MPSPSHEAIAAAATPVQRGAIALSGARAHGMVGRFDRAVALCRQALAHADAYEPALRERLEAELACNGWLDASTIEEARGYVRDRAPAASALELWRVSAGMAGMLENRPAAETQALLRPVLEQDVLAAEPGSLLGSVATLHLIVDEELERAVAQCTR